VGSEKRERQKLSRQAKIEAAEIAARRTRTKRTGIRVAVAAIVVIGAMFAYSAISGGDDDDSAADEETVTSTSTTVPETTTTTYSNPELAEEVLGREAPDPAPPPADTAGDALGQETLIEGEGDGAAEGDTVVVHYVGKTADGNVFDESWSRGQTFPVTLGPTAGVIDGWNEGLVGVKAGERRHLVIGSDKAYGAEGGGDVIPPDAPLAFDVDVVDIIRADQAE
jgi:peptidylprolyl isomerase